MLRTNAYQDPGRATGMPREIEYQLVSRITADLRRHTAADSDYPAFVKALHDNLTFWRTVAFAVMDDDNALPDQLRAQLFYLFEFVNDHTPKVWRGDADAAVLIDINKAIMGGLKGRVPQAEVVSCPV